MDIDGGRKVFLSHKGSDKSTVIDFKQTLQGVGIPALARRRCDACRYP